MKMSEISLADVKARLRIDYNTDDAVLTSIMAAARAMIADRTGRTLQELDGFDQAYHLFMVICQHMYDNNVLVASVHDLDFAAQALINQMISAEAVLA